MVKTQNLVPHVYYKESRDFQYFGRLFDIIFNYCKTNTDLLKKIDYKSQSNLIDLVIQTLGFEPISKTRIDSLYQLSLIWSSMIKNKGNMKSIETLLKSLLNFERSSANIDISPKMISTGNTYNSLDINLSSDITDNEIYLIEKVLDYILPVTVIYQINKVSVQSQETGYITQNEYAEADYISTTDVMSKDNSYMNIQSGYKSKDEKLKDINKIDQGDIRFSKVAQDPKSNT